MYRLLLVSDQDAYTGIAQQTALFEDLGFRQPKVAYTVNEAIEGMKNRRFDAIAYRMTDPSSEGELYDYLQQAHPIMPIFELSLIPAKQSEILSRLCSLLNRTHADFSNDNFGEADMMMLCRHEFLRDMLSETIRTQEELYAGLRLLRSTMDPSKACVVLDMEMPEGAEYFAGKWHYGADRLETALRNFFGREIGRMRMVTSVVAPERIRVLACPMLGMPDSDEAESMTADIAQHVNEALEQVREYLSLDLRVVSMRVLQNLSALTADRDK